MKTENHGWVIALNNHHLKEITKEVKETLATGDMHVSDKLFSTADLWNIQRRKKRMLRRYV